jgi:hypothetical protein
VDAELAIDLRGWGGPTSPYSELLAAPGTAQSQEEDWRESNNYIKGPSSLQWRSIWLSIRTSAINVIERMRLPLQTHSEFSFENRKNFGFTHCEEIE